MTRASAARRWSRRAVVLAVAGVLALGTLLVATAVDLTSQQGDDGASGPLAPVSGTATEAAPQRTPHPGEPPFLTSVSPDGRYFLDQHGDPFLVRGDSPWSLMTDLLPAQAELYFADREENGFNASIVSLLGAVENGAPSDDGATVDGVLPFRDGDITAWNEQYWERVERIVQAAADHGNTLLLYPTDGWVMSTIFAETSLDDCFAYGAMVAERFADHPNIVWMAGGDYFPLTNSPEVGSTHDYRIAAVLNGIRSTGDRRPFSIQLGYDKSISTDNPYWAERVDWNVVYTYYPTYKAVLDAYTERPARPALFAEGNYEGENNQGDTPGTTNETLRRQVLWALTSGSPGDVFGSDDWEFHDGWQDRLDTPAVAQIHRLRDLVASLEWWRLVPDVAERFVAADGRGTRILSDEPMDVLDNDYVTAAFDPDGSFGVVYVPTRRTITLDLGLLGDSPEATWIDPSTGTGRSAGTGPAFTTPGRNADGDEDWLLVLRAGA
jgi:hypothetical protein